MSARPSYLGLCLSSTFVMSACHPGSGVDSMLLRDLAGGTPDLVGTSPGDAGGTSDLTDTGLNCLGGGAEITQVPACATAGMNSTVDVPSGCAPTVDGALHMNEWSDGACFVAGHPDGALTIRMKYAGDSFYMAVSGSPTCGCGMPFHFDPDGGTTLDGDEFIISLADDPITTNGDRADLIARNGAFTLGAAPAGILTAGPPNMPSPVRSEWRIPLSVLGITPGHPHTFRFGVNHNGQMWPGTLRLDQMGQFSTKPDTWGQVSSSTSWK